MDRPRLLNSFINLGHAADHLLMLIFPTVVLAMAPVFGWSYGDMLKLSLGGFIAFGAFSLPAGWLGDRWSRRGMMIVFFFGAGGAAILAGCAQTPWQLAVALTLVGMFGGDLSPRRHRYAGQGRSNGSAARSASTGSGAISASPLPR